MEPTDIQLMLRARTGDKAAFHQLAQRYREPLRRFFAALLPDRSEAEDCVQETFLRLWLNREQYEPTGKFSTYLFQFGKHHALNQRKKYRRKAAYVVVEEGLELLPSPRTQPDRMLEEQAHQARIRAAIAALPKHYREVFEMSHFQDIKYAEIACRLNIPLGTVKSRMAEAVRRLRQRLREGEGEN